MLIQSVILIFICASVDAQTREVLEQQFAGERCLRDCTNAQPRICYFHWTLEHYHTMGPACGQCSTGSNADCYREQCIAADGIPRGVMSINRKIPGPPIQVCKNDWIVVDVLNEMGGTGATIHWHGILQRETPWMDGVPSVTQCPIEFATTFRYYFKAADPGTQWYHSHAGHHKTNGEIGAVIVRQPKRNEMHRNEYDEDLPQHHIVISDWMDTHAEQYVPGLRQTDGVLPDNLLLNGRGIRRTRPNTAAQFQTPLEVFRVQKGRRYRFRLINAMSHICPTAIEIEKHTLRVIASDSFDVEPLDVERLVSNSGERYDFVINANGAAGGNFWIRVQGMGPCEGLMLEQFAILTYDTSTPLTTLAFNYGTPPAFETPLNRLSDRNLNDPHTDCIDPEPGSYCVTDLSSYDLGRGIVDVPFDHQFFLGFNNIALNTTAFFQGNDYTHFISLPNDVVLAGSISRISFEFPPSPLLSQLNQLNGVTFCSEGNLPPKCRNAEVCHCVHRIQVPLNAIVELIIVDEVSRVGLINHPFHLHGHRLYVMEMGQRPDVEQMTVPLAKTMVRASYDSRNGREDEGRKYPIKDTISIPSKGWTRFRFKADNPGFWLLHCHFEWHLAIGMGLVLQVGQPNQMVPPPPNFPTCGNFENDVRFLLRQQG